MDSNPGPQDDRRKWNHGAMVATQHYNCYLKLKINTVKDQLAWIAGSKVHETAVTVTIKCYQFDLFIEHSP